MTDPRPNRPSRALSWDGYWGVCFYREAHLTLFRAPVIPGMSIEQIDYAPVVRQRQVLERGGSWRPLTDEEALRIDQMMARMVMAAEAEVCGPC
jgi:hypothetical protein